MCNVRENVTYLTGLLCFELLVVRELYVDGPASDLWRVVGVVVHHGGCAADVRHL